jgi:hypothetical protein
MPFLEMNLMTHLSQRSQAEQQPFSTLRSLRIFSSPMKALDLSELERKTTSRVHRARGREGTRATDPPLVGLPPVSVSYEMAEMKRPIATIATAIPRLRSTLLPIITLPV